MSNLKVGDLVMVGGAASAEDRAKNAGRFRTVVGFVPAGFHYVGDDGCTYKLVVNCAILDGCVWSEFEKFGKEAWNETLYKNISALVKINPGDAEDETLTWVGKPLASHEGSGKPNKQTEPDKESV